MASALINVGFFLAAAFLIQTLTLSPLVAGYEIVDPLTGYIYVPASAPHDSEAFAPDLYVDDSEPPASPGAPVASQETIEFVRSCGEKMDEQCGEEIFSHILEDTHVTEPCCEKLLKMGMKCHVTIASIVLSTDELKAKQAETIPRSKKIWNTCVSDVGSKIGVPVSLET